MERASLIVPQGWGIRVWRLLLEGSGLFGILPTIAVMVGAGALFFALGVIKFNRRYA
jgi:ABC-type multidrug transport system permease subunit